MKPIKDLMTDLRLMRVHLERNINIILRVLRLNNNKKYTFKLFFEQTNYSTIILLKLSQIISKFMFGKLNVTHFIMLRYIQKRFLKNNKKIKNTNIIGLGRKFFLIL